MKLEGKNIQGVLENAAIKEKYILASGNPLPVSHHHKKTQPQANETTIQLPFSFARDR